MSNQMDQACFNILSNSRRLLKEDLDNALKTAKEKKISFAEQLVESGLMKEHDLLEELSKSLGVPFVNLKKIKVDKSVLDKVSIKYAEHYKFFPLKLVGKTLHAAVHRLLDSNTLDEMRLGLGYKLELSLAVEKDIEAMLKSHYGLGAQTASQILGSDPDKSNRNVSVTALDEVEDIEKLAETASVGQLVNQIILDAYTKRASDIHVEPYRGEIRVRYRIDGALQDAPASPDLKRFLLPILSRIKIMANLDIVEKRLPQDGKARVKTQDQELDLRVSSIPTPHGESMVIRILQRTMIFSLEKLGLEPKQIRIFKELIHRPHGIIFVTGPTGSGKSTTLYAGLTELNSIRRKIITIEDPVEYELGGVTQIQVMPDIGLTFARGLRSMLRHDPDVMMVGEVRDLETADIAIRVALTGHLVLSTLHTNDAASGVTRLLEMGVEPFLVSSSVNAFIAQRLVRRICEHCRVEDPKASADLIDTIRRDLRMRPNTTPKIYKGKGCDECNGSGFNGRLAIHEILIVDEKIRQLLFSKAQAEDIKKEARVQGMSTLREDGWQKVIQGLTTPDEIYEATPIDEILTPVLHEKLPVHDEIPLDSVQTEMLEAKSVVKAGSQTDRLNSERRKYKRVDVSVALSYRPVDQSALSERSKSGGTSGDGSGQSSEEFQAWKMTTQTNDLSASGISFNGEGEGLRPGVTLELKMKLPDGAAPVECLGRVMHISRTINADAQPQDSKVKIGLAFIAINSDDRTRIEKICQAQAEQDENI